MHRIAPLSTCGNCAILLDIPAHRPTTGINSAGTEHCMHDPNQEHAERLAALTCEYNAVVSNFRGLTEIRFKLISLLPAASLATAALKPDARLPGSLPFALFGLAAT